MNIEIANRLVQLRKMNNLSQEALAEKLGISRQAVSKWERAEASPDTDNLILLSRIYGVSLDELLKTEDEIPIQQEEESHEAILMEETDGEEKDEYVHGDDRRSVRFPMSLLLLIAYFVIGCKWNAWHPGWLLFLMIPIWYSLLEAIEKKKPACFAYPVLATLVYLCLGIFRDAWHPGWVVFLTIPLYYSMVSYFRERKRSHRSKGKADRPEYFEDRQQGDVSGAKDFADVERDTQRESGAEGQGSEYEE